MVEQRKTTVSKQPADRGHTRGHGRAGKSKKGHTDSHSKEPHVMPYKPADNEENIKPYNRRDDHRQQEMHPHETPKGEKMHIMPLFRGKLTCEAIQSLSHRKQKQG